MQLKYKKLMIGDLLLAELAFYAALRLRFDVSYAHHELFGKSLARPLIFAVTLVTISFLLEMYTLSKQRSKYRLLLQSFLTVAISFPVLSALLFLIPDWKIGRGLVAISLLLFLVLQFAWHILYRKIFKLPYLSEKIIIIGTDDIALKIASLIRGEADAHHLFAGYVETGNPLKGRAECGDGPVLGVIADLLDIVRRAGATQLIVSRPQDLDDGISQHLLLNCKFEGTEICSASTYFENTAEKLMLEHLDLNDLIYASGFRYFPIGVFIKRVMDIVFASAGILLLLPFLPLLIVLVKLNSPGPVFYRQSRTGYMGKVFTIYKFRTMDVEAEEKSGAVWAEFNDARIRPLGRFLRRTRLDETPQLFNVLTGDMSLVGPRPERPEFVRKLQEIIPYYGKRHFLKPGITGWAQIKYRYGASAEDAFEKLRYDLYYFKHMNPIMDLIILLKTVRVIISQFGGR